MELIDSKNFIMKVKIKINLDMCVLIKKTYGDISLVY